MKKKINKSHLHRQIKLLATRYNQSSSIEWKSVWGIGQAAGCCPSNKGRNKGLILSLCMSSWNGLTFCIRKCKLCWWSSDCAYLWKLATNSACFSSYSDPRPHASHRLSHQESTRLMLWTVTAAWTKGSKLNSMLCCDKVVCPSCLYTANNRTNVVRAVLGVKSTPKQFWMQFKIHGSSGWRGFIMDYYGFSKKSLDWMNQFRQQAWLTNFEREG